MANSHAWMIADAVPDKGTLVEFGGGSSTFFWLENTPAAELYVIEHNSEYYRAISERASDLWMERLFLFHIPISGQKGRFHEDSRGASEYASGGDGVVPLDQADVILIDGHVRCLCLAYSAMRAKKGAVMFLHDSEDPVYAWAKKFMHGHPDWRPVSTNVIPPPEDDFRNVEMAYWERIN